LCDDFLPAQSDYRDQKYQNSYKDGFREIEEKKARFD